MAINKNSLEIVINVSANDAKGQIDSVKNSLLELGKAYRQAMNSSMSEGLAEQESIRRKKEKKKAIEDNKSVIASETSVIKDIITASQGETKAKGDSSKATSDSSRVRKEAVQAARQEKDALKEVQKTNEMDVAIRIKAAGSQRSFTDAIRGSYLPLIAVNQALQLASATINGLESAISSVLSPATELQTQIAKINTLLSDTERASFSASNEIKKMVSLTGSNQADMAAAFYDLIASGAVKANDAAQVLTVTQKLATGGMTTLADATKIVRSVIAAYSMDVSEAAKVSDTLFIVARDGATDVQQLSQELGSALGIASQLGVPFEELASAISAVTLSGVSTSESTTSLISAMISLARQSKDMTATLEDMGITSIQAAIKQKGLVGVLEELKKATGGSSEAIINLMGRVEGMKAFTALTSSSIGGSFKKMLQNTREGFNTPLAASKKAADEMANTVDSQMTRVGNRTKILGATLGDAFTGPLTSVLKSLNQNLGETQKYVEAISRTLKSSDISGLVKDLALMAGIFAAAGAAATGFSGALAGITASLGWISAAVAGIAAVVSAPATLIGLAIVGVTLALLELRQSIKSWLGDTYEPGPLLSLFYKLSNGSKDLDKNLKAIDHTVIKLGDSLSSVTQPIKDFLDNIQGLNTNITAKVAVKSSLVPLSPETIKGGFPSREEPSVAPSDDTLRRYNQISESIKTLRDQYDKLNLSEVEQVKAIASRDLAELKSVERRLSLEKRLTSERVKVIREAGRLIGAIQVQNEREAAEKTKSIHDGLMSDLATMDSNRVKVIQLSYEKELAEWNKALREKQISKEEYDKLIKAYNIEYKIKIAGTEQAMEELGSFANKVRAIVSRGEADQFQLKKDIDKKMPDDAVPGKTAAYGGVWAPEKIRAEARETYKIIDKMFADLEKEFEGWRKNGLIDPKFERGQMEEVTRAAEKMISDLQNKAQIQLKMLPEQPNAITASGGKMTATDAEQNMKEVQGSLANAKALIPGGTLFKIEEVRKEVDEVLNIITTKMDAAIPYLVSKMFNKTTMNTAANDAAQEVSEKFVNSIDKFGTGFSKLMKGMGDIFQMSGATESWAAFWEKTKATAGNAIDWIGNVFASMGKMLVGVVENLGSMLKSALMTVMSNLNIFTMLVQFFNKDEEEFKKQIASSIDTVLQLVPRLAENIPTLLASVISYIPEMIIALVARLPELIVNVFSGVVTGVINLLSDLDWFFNELVTGFIDSLFTAFKMLFQSIGTLLGKVLLDALTLPLSIIIQAVDGVINLFSKMFGGKGNSNLNKNFQKDMAIAVGTGEARGDTQKKRAKGWVVGTSGNKEVPDTINADQKKGEQPDAAKYKAVGGSEFRVKQYEGALSNTEEKAFRLASDTFDEKAQEFGESLGTAETSFFSGVGNMLESGIEKMGEWGQAIWDGFVKILDINTIISWGTKMGSEIISAFSWIYNTILKPVATLWISTWQWIFNTILMPVINLWMSTWMWIFNTILMPIINLWISTWMWIFDTILMPVINLWISTWQLIFDTILMPVINLFISTFQWIYDTILMPVINLWISTWMWIFDNILMPVINLWMSTWKWIFDTFLMPFITVLGTTFQWISTIFAPIIDSFKSAFGWISSVLSPIAQMFKDSFQWIYNTIFKPFMDVVNALRGVIDSAVGAVQSVTNPTGKGGVLTSIGNGAVSAVKSVGKFLGFADGGIVPALKYLPSFADGGVVSGSSFSSGDSQKNDRIMSMLSPGEFVIPKSMVSSMLNGGGSGQGGVVQNISVNISVAAGSSLSDGTLKREVVPKIVEELRKMSQNGAQVLSKRGVY